MITPKRKKHSQVGLAGSKATDLPKLPSPTTRPLGLEGWTAFEPVLLGALAYQESLLPIGSHGSEKRFIFKRLAQTVGLEYRFCNVSLTNYEDPAGIPFLRKSGWIFLITTLSAVFDELMHHCRDVVSPREVAVCTILLIIMRFGGHDGI